MTRGASGSIIPQLQLFAHNFSSLMMPVCMAWYFSQKTNSFFLVQPKVVKYFFSWEITCRVIWGKQQLTRKFFVSECKQLRLWNILFAYRTKSMYCIDDYLSVPYYTMLQNHKICLSHVEVITMLFVCLPLILGLILITEKYSE